MRALALAQYTLTVRPAATGAEMSSFDAIAIGACLLSVVISLWAASRGYLLIGRIARTVAHVLSLGGTAGLFESLGKAGKARRKP